VIIMVVDEQKDQQQAETAEVAGTHQDAAAATAFDTLHRKEEERVPLTERNNSADGEEKVEESLVGEFLNKGMFERPQGYTIRRREGSNVLVRSLWCSVFW
jgi:hypothetical protein